MMPPAKPLRHGRASTYINDRCRCVECRKAMREYRLDYARRQELRERPWRLRLEAERAKLAAIEALI